jgi:hypothetical protein
MRVDILNEANLNLRELSVGSGEGLRGDTLVRKIRDDEPITMRTKDGHSDVVVVNKDQVLKAITNRDGTFNAYRAAKYFTIPDAHKRYRPDALLGEDGRHYKLNDIEKTAEFGSSGGSGLGSRDTRYVESITCVFLAWRQLKRTDLTELDYDDIISLPAESYLDFRDRYTQLDSRLELSQSDISRYWDKWADSFIHIPNFLYREGIVGSGYKNEHLLDPGKVYRFCQLSGTGGAVAALRRVFRERHPGINFAKWNPSDVFAVERDSEAAVEEQLLKCRTNLGLNEIVDRFFDTRQMVGVSLKKVKGSEDIKIVVNKITRPPKYKLSTIRFSRLPLATLGLEVLAERISREFGHGKEVMVVRSRDSSKMINISAEVRGKTAKHGNMSLTQINRILDSYGLEKVPGVGSRTEQHYADSIEDWSDADLKREIVAINNKLLNHYDTVVEPRGTVTEVDRMRLISKYQSLFLAWVLMEAQDYLSDRDGYTLADRVVEDMFHFALSINITPGKESGRTPRYARIVD